MWELFLKRATVDMLNLSTDEIIQFELLDRSGKGIILWEACDT